MSAAVAAAVLVVLVVSVVLLVVWVVVEPAVTATLATVMGADAETDVDVVGDDAAAGLYGAMTTGGCGTAGGVDAVEEAGGEMRAWVFMYVAVCGLLCDTSDVSL